MITATVRDLCTQLDVKVLDHLDRQAHVPVLTGPQIQGDVSILPVTTAPATTPIPAPGVAVVRGENGGNTHSLHGSATFDLAEARDGSLTLGTLTVPDGGEAFMAHPEHGFMGIGPGTYRIGRQREFGGEWRMVAD
jgi:hypothetical protein